MGNSVPKQFLPLKGKSIIFHTLDAFKNAIEDIQLVIVLPEDQIQYWKDLSKDSPYADIPLAIGGKERTDSVRAGLKMIPKDSLVGIHDSVRPFASKDCIQRSFETALKYGNAIPCMPLTESLRKVEAENSKAVDRASYRIVQTPQCFHTNLIKEAYDHLDQACTDDASVLEAFGVQINLVEGNKENIKITEPADLKIAEAILED